MKSGILSPNLYTILGVEDQLYPSPPADCVLYLSGYPPGSATIYDYSNAFYDTALNTAEELDNAETDVDCSASATTLIPVGSVIRIESEQMLVSATGTTLTVSRGYNGTTPAIHATAQDIYKLTANHGAITGATWARLSSGLWTLAHDGNDDYVTIDSTLTQLATTTTGTWLIWAKLTDATPAVAPTFISFGDTNANEQIGFYSSTAGKLSAGLTDAGVQQWTLATNSAVFADGVWALIGLTQNGTSPVLYFNGVAVAQAFSVSTNKTRWFSVCTGLDNGRIGVLNFNSGGNVADLAGGTALCRLLTSALTAAQHLSIYQQERHLFGV